MDLLVLWDGDCGFCEKSLDWVRHKSPRGVIRYLSFHSDEAATWREKIGAGALEKAMHVVDEEGNIYPGADGFAQLLLRIPGWHWLGRLMGLPVIKQACRAGYRAVAANRARLGKHACKLKKP